MTVKNLEVKNVMHPDPHSIAPNQSLEVAMSILQSHNIRHLPVIHMGKIEGIITDRDIEFALRVEKKSPKELLVKDCYTSEPYIVDCKTKVSNVAKTMAHQHIGCALVTENNKLVGIFTTVDACRLLSEVLSEAFEQ